MLKNKNVNNIDEILYILKQDYNKLITSNQFQKATGIFRAIYLINEYKNDLDPNYDKERLTIHEMSKLIKKIL